MILMSEDPKLIQKDFNGLTWICGFVGQVLLKASQEGAQRGITPEQFEDMKKHSMNFLDKFIAPLIKTHEEFLKSPLQVTPSQPPPQEVIELTENDMREVEIAVENLRIKEIAEEKESINALLKASAQSDAVASQPIPSTHIPAPSVNLTAPPAPRKKSKSGQGAFKSPMTNLIRSEIASWWSQNPDRTEKEIEDFSTHYKVEGILPIHIKAWIKYLDSLRKEHPSRVPSGWNYICKKFEFTMPLPDFLAAKAAT